ncbi:MATH domain and coiled-coil domain-containing protein At3g58370 [Eutrema salsugineum]|nr:MATH domain and coiled-coil domain-containing protein At3g58370 [Eutrema salsugineum]
MGNKADEKFTWVISINNLSYLQSIICSDIFVVGRCKWRLVSYPKGRNKRIEYLSLFLEVADHKSLPCGWRRRAKIRINVVNHLSKERSKMKGGTESDMWFNQQTPGWGFGAMLPLRELYAKDGGFLTDGKVEIVAEINVLKVIGKFDVEEAENSTQPLKKMKLNVSNDSLISKTELLSVDFNGFQILPSEVESVRRIFEKHPDFASEFRSKNRHLKSTYMNFLLGLIETLCQSPQELTDDDLDKASVGVSYLEKGGLKVDWLEKKVEEVKEKKKKVDTGRARVQEMDDELKKLIKKCIDIKDLVDKEIEDITAANVSLSFDDVV